MRKRIMSAVLALCLTVTLLPVNARAADASSGRWGTNLAWAYDEDSKTLTISGKGAMSNAEIDRPEETEQFKTAVQHVVIGSEVLSVGASAFKDWTALEDVSLPENMAVIGSHAFQGCTALAGITIPANVNYIGYGSFSGTQISEITIPEGVLSLGPSAFYKCTSLETVELPSTLYNIGSRAFEGCTALTRVDGLNHVKSIDLYAFDGCVSLQSINLNENVQLHRGAFHGCTSLTSVVIPSGCTMDTDGTTVGVFEGCTSLLNIEIEEGVTRIDESMFKNCTSLETIAFPQSMTSIPYQNTGALNGCTSLKTIRFLGLSKVQRDALNVLPLPEHYIKGDNGDPITFVCDFPGGTRKETQTYGYLTADCYTCWWYDSKNNILNLSLSVYREDNMTFTIKPPEEGAPPLEWEPYLDYNPQIVIGAKQSYIDDRYEQPAKKLIIKEGVFKPGAVLHLYGGVYIHEGRSSNPVHTLTPQNLSYATCRQDGHTEGYECEDCTMAGPPAPKPVPMSAHKVEEQGTAPTCQSAGTAFGLQCKSCNHILLEALESPPPTTTSASGIPP